MQSEFIFLISLLPVKSELLAFQREVVRQHLWVSQLHACPLDDNLAVGQDICGLAPSIVLHCDLCEDANDEHLESFALQCFAREFKACALTDRWDVLFLHGRSVRQLS